MASQVEHIKWVPGTSFIVDGFAFATPRCQHYFLTHCHSDHTVGLTRRFSGGTIWCSPVSTRLLAAEWGLRAPTVRQLQLNQPVVIEGVTVTALDANHCPGAVMLLFEVRSRQGSGIKRILHTGDCRWHDGLYTASCLAHKPIDTLMLDTTYALPKHTFPPQHEAISSMVQLMREALQEEPNTLLVVSCYHIGKERAFLGAAAALGLKVYVTAAKLRVLQLLDLPENLLSVLSRDPASQLHVGCTRLVPDELQAYLGKQQQEQQQGRHWKRIMGFRATGWSYRRSGGLHVQRPYECVALVGVPYSEHSSWSDLRHCVAKLRPKKLIPTVNASTHAEQQALVDQFADLMDLSCDRGRIDAYLVRTAGAGARPPAAAAADTGADPPATLHLTANAMEAATEAAAAAAGLPATAADPSSGHHQLCAPLLEATTQAAGGSNSFDAAMSSGFASSSAATGMQLPSNAETPLASSLGSRGSSNHISSSSSGDILDAGSTVPACISLLAPAGVLAASNIGIAGEVQTPPHDAPALDGFDMSSVDIGEQQRLLEDAERRQKLRMSLLKRAAGRGKGSKGKGRGSRAGIKSGSCTKKTG